MANRTMKKEWEEQEMDFKTFMSLMVVLIPMLLVCAQFAKIAVIEIKLPEGRGSQTMTKVKKPLKAEESNKLLLTAVITDSVVTLGAKGGFLPSVFYQEYHRYVDKDNKAVDFTVKYDPKTKEQPKHPISGRPMEIYERYDIYLYACPEDFSEIIKCLYTNSGGNLCADATSLPIKEAVNVGDTIYELTNPRKLVVVQDPAEYEIKELSVYDELKNRLLKVKERFKDAEDSEDIIIAAENQVIYDKIVQIMDAAKQADFPNISIAKLRSF
jgi:biopolymer transport protein ExbD